MFEISQGQAEGEEREEQENELLALEAIFENEDIELIEHDNPEGHLPGKSYCFVVEPEKNQLFFLCTIDSSPFCLFFLLDVC